MPEPTPDPRQPAYDAVYAYIRSSNRVPGDVVTRNAMIWRAVEAALDAIPLADQPAEHCIHDRGIHHRHHQPRNPIIGCPWCEDAGVRVDEVPTGGLT